MLFDSVMAFGPGLAAADGPAVLPPRVRLALLGAIPLLIGLGSVLLSIKGVLGNDNRTAPLQLLVVGLFCFSIGLPMLLLGQR